LHPVFQAQPENIDYTMWTDVFVHGGQVAKGKWIKGEAKGAYEGKKWSTAKMLADAQAILDKFRGVDIDAIIADLLRRFPDMDQYERDHLESAVAIWKARLDMISPDDVVKVILR